MKKMLLLLLTAWGCLSVNFAYADKQPQTDKEKFSYAVGIQLAQNILRQSIQVDTEAFIQAIKDVLNNTEMKLTLNEMQEILVNYQKQQQTLQMQQAEKNKAAGDKFLATNKTKDGVVELPSGLQYKVITKGDGKKPSIDDNVLVHYRGTSLDGKEFDSSYKRGEPTTLGLKNVIKGWQEALMMMAVGSKWQIYVPSTLAYGQQAAGPDIQANSTLIFDIELIAIN